MLGVSRMAMPFALLCYPWEGVGVHCGFRFLLFSRNLDLVLVDFEKIIATWLGIIP
jgi:hypothetical protein